MIVTRKVRYEQRFICAHCGKETCRESDKRCLRSTRKYCTQTCRQMAYLLRRLRTSDAN